MLKMKIYNTNKINLKQVDMNKIYLIMSFYNFVIQKLDLMIL